MRETMKARRSRINTSKIVIILAFCVMIVSLTRSSNRISVDSLPELQRKGRPDDNDKDTNRSKISVQYLSEPRRETVQVKIGHESHPTSSTMRNEVAQVEKMPVSGVANGGEGRKETEAKAHEEQKVEVKVSLSVARPTSNITSNGGVDDDKSGQARYDLDPLSFGKPDLFEGRTEIFVCDRRHWRSDVCTMKGDVRVDARRNIVILFAKENTTKRGVEVIKAYPRKWEKELMNVKVKEIILLSIEAPQNLEPWEPSTEEERQEIMARDNVTEDNSREAREREMVIKFDSTGVYEMGNGSNWSEEVWKIKRAQGLQQHVSQLWFYEEEREKNGKYLMERGGFLESEGRHAWILFNNTKYLTRNDVEIELPQAPGGTESYKCDVRHTVPGVLFSASGYTGNVYHEFNDGLIPLYITSAHYDGNYVPIIENAELWWVMKYENILRKLSNFPAVLLGRERYIHCFSEVIVGLRIHDEMTVYPQLMPNSQGNIQLFQKTLEEGWKDYPYFDPHPEGEKYGCKPLMTLISRAQTRVLTNEAAVIRLAQKLGFFVRIMKTERHFPLAEVWKNLQDSNLMVGVHGAAMTHFIFMRPNSTYIQILPLGTDWPAKTYYGDPAIRLGVQYTEYKVDIEESSLSLQYPPNDTVLVDPQSFFHKVGWWTAKEVYLEHQNVTLNLKKFRKALKHVKQQLKVDPLFIEHRQRRTSAVCKEKGQRITAL